MKKMDLGNAEPPQENSNAKAQMAVMDGFGFLVSRDVSELRIKFCHTKKVHLELVLLALELEHEFNIILTLLLAASNDPFNDFNGSKVMLRTNSLSPNFQLCIVYVNLVSHQNLWLECLLFRI